MNSKWTKDLNKELKTMTLLEENIEASLHDLGFVNDFLHILKAQARNEKIEKLDFTKV